MALFSYQMPFGNVDKLPQRRLKCSVSVAPLRIFGVFCFSCWFFVCWFNISKNRKKKQLKWWEGKTMFFLLCSLNTITISTQIKDFKLATATASHLRDTPADFLQNTIFWNITIPHFDLMIERGYERGKISRQGIHLEAVCLLISDFRGRRFSSWLMRNGP